MFTVFFYLHFSASKLYHETPFGTRKIVGHEISEQIRVRLEYECRLVREYLNDDWTFRHGPSTE